MQCTVIQNKMSYLGMNIARTPAGPRKQIYRALLKECKVNTRRQEVTISMNWKHHCCCSFFKLIYTCNTTRTIQTFL